MINITDWTSQFLQALDVHFGSRVWFAGIQGSYARCEANDTSDIDIVVILDTLNAADVDGYRNMLDTLPHRELICGFLSAKQDILNWEPADLFQFYHDTIPIRGSLDVLLTLIDDAAVVRAIKTGAGNILHGCIHNMLFERNGDVLKGLYKSASFVLQAIAYRESGTYYHRQQDLLHALSDDNRLIAKIFMDLKGGAPIHFNEMSAVLMTWAQAQLQITQ